MAATTSYPSGYVAPALEARSGFDQVRLIYGIELEFMIAYSVAEVTARPDYQKQETELLHQKLAQGGSYEDMNDELANAQKEIIRQQVRKALKDFRIPLADDPQRSKKGPHEYNGWTVTGDGTVTAKKSLLDSPSFQFLDGKRPQDEPDFDAFREQVEFVDMELVSPVWRLADLHANSEEIRKVIRVIASRFQVFVPPKTAAFHVHVGNGDAGFSLLQTQNMALLFSTFERQFSQFHAEHRLNSVHCRLPRSLFRPDDRDLPGMWDAILNLPRDKGKLEVRGRDGHNRVLHGDEARLTWLIGRMGINRFKKDARTAQAYNFGLVLGQDGKRAKTIQFRQHQGTLHPKTINGWVLAVCAMVDVCCHATNPAFLDDLLDQREEDLNFPVADLFRGLYLGDLVDDNDGSVCGRSVHEHSEDFGWKDFDYYQRFNTYDMERDNKYDGNNLSKYFGTDTAKWSVSPVGSTLVDRSSVGSQRSAKYLEQSLTDSGRSI